MKLACLLFTACLSYILLSSCTPTTGSRPQNSAGLSRAPISKGMNKQTVRTTWGKPNEILVLSNGKEQWIYKRPADRYLDFPINLIARRSSASLDDEFVRGSSISHERIDVLEIDRTVVFANGKVEAWTRLRD